MESLLPEPVTIPRSVYAGSLHWFSLFSAKVVLANLFLEQNDAERARKVVQEIKGRFRGRAFRVIQFQMEALERVLEEKDAIIRLKKAAFESRATEMRILPEKDNLRRMVQLGFLQSRGWLGPKVVVHNLA